MMNSGSKEVHITKDDLIQSYHSLHMRLGSLKQNEPFQKFYRAATMAKRKALM